MADVKANDSSGQLLTFECCGEIYAFDILSVLDIIEIYDITPLPLVADYILGIINLRGKAVPVMDLALKLGLGEPEYNAQSCMIVVDCDGSPLAVKVERVIDAESYSRMGMSLSPVENSYVIGYAYLNDRRVTVLDCVKLTS